MPFYPARPHTCSRFPFRHANALSRPLPFLKKRGQKRKKGSFFKEYPAQIAPCILGVRSLFRRLLQLGRSDTFPGVLLVRTELSDKVSESSGKAQTLFCCATAESFLAKTTSYYLTQCGKIGMFFSRFGGAINHEDSCKIWAVRGKY